MRKADMHIEIVCSTDPRLSSMSLPSREMVKTTLSRHYKTVGISIVNNVVDLETLVSLQPGLVFLGMKFIPNNPELGHHDPDKIWISQFLDVHNIAYTGSGYFAHELELNKSLAKKRVAQAGLKTAQFLVVKQGSLVNRTDLKLTFPLFVKPTSCGGGRGIDEQSLAYNLEQLNNKITSLWDTLKTDVLIEEYLPGREFTVAILKDEQTQKLSAMPLELVAPKDIHGVSFLSSKVKNENMERSTIVEDDFTNDKVKAFAVEVFKALGARDYGRIDIRLDAIGEPHFIEANLIPGIKKSLTNYYPKACRLNAGLEYEPMILSITRLALARVLTDENKLFVPTLGFQVLEPVFEVI